MERFSENYLIIDERVLPEVFQKVIHANNLLENGEARNTSEATKMAGISRSVYYKYRDAVFPYVKRENSEIITVQLVLMDRPGILMNLLAFFYKANANILTVNQNIPVRGRALVSVSAKSNRMSITEEDFLEGLREVEGVVKIDSIA